MARVDGISLDNEQSDEHTVSLEKLSTLETVCLLSKLHEAKHYVNVTLEMDELDSTFAEITVTYKMAIHIYILSIARSVYFNIQTPSS